MKALSLHQPYASLVGHGLKTVETRRWSTRHRGELLICASKAGNASDGLARGVAVCIVRVVDCRPMTDADAEPACIERYPGAWAWVLEHVRPVPPVPIRGGRRLFNVDWPAELARWRPTSSRNDHRAVGGPARSQ